MQRTPGAPRIGLWGTYDVENLGDVLFPRIARAELARRLPEATIRTFSPFGAERPIPFDGEDAAEPLGPRSDERLAELADALDLVVVGQGEIVHGRDELWGPMYGVPEEAVIERAPSAFFIEGLGASLERVCPVVWSAVALPFDVDPDGADRYRRALASRPHVSVRDESSRRRLERAGVDREVGVIPPPAVLLSRLFPPEALERRVEQLRILGWMPEERPGLVVQGSGSLADVAGALSPHVKALADDLGAEVVLVETDPAHDDRAFAEAMRAELGDRARHAVGATAEDVLAAISASAGFVGDSLHGNVAAFAFGRPHAILAFGGTVKLQDFARLAEREEALAADPEGVEAAFKGSAAAGARPDLVRALARRVDEEFDRIAEVAALAARRRTDAVPPAVDADLRRELDALRASHAALGRRIAADRVALARNVEDRAGRHREEVARLEGEIEDRDAEIAALRRTLADETQRLEAEVADRERQIRELLNTRTYRYTAFLRRIWGRVRRLGR